MFCPRYRQGVCSCQTQLRRDRAERLILAEISRRILKCPGWFSAVFEAAQQAWQKWQADVPSELQANQRVLADVDLKIKRLVDRIEAGDDDPEISRRLDERRTERRECDKKLERLKQRNDQPSQPPTEAWLRERLSCLDKILHDPTPATIKAFSDLVGGQIVVTEIREEGRQRHYLRGQFILRATAVVQASLDTEGRTATIDSAAVENELCEQITIAFVDPDPLDAPSEEAKALCDQGLLKKEIAARMKCSKSQITKLIKHWYASRGEQMPDGRTRRSSLQVKHTDPPLYQQLAEPAIELWQGGWLMQDIATKLGCDRNTVTAAVKFAHESRGLPFLDGRNRRKTLPRRGDHKEDQQRS